MRLPFFVGESRRDPRVGLVSIRSSLSRLGRWSLLFDLLLDGTELLSREPKMVGISSGNDVEGAKCATPGSTKDSNRAKRSNRRGTAEDFRRVGLRSGAKTRLDDGDIVSLKKSSFKEVNSGVAICKK